MSENQNTISENNNNTNNNTEQKNTQDPNQNKENKNIPPKKDLMKEKAEEIKSLYDQMIKLRKQNLEGSKKLEMSK